MHVSDFYFPKTIFKYQPVENIFNISTLSYQKVLHAEVLPESIFLAAFAGFYAINGNKHNC
jgi:hypothetical protein